MCPCVCVCVCVAFPTIRSLRAFGDWGHLWLRDRLGEWVLTLNPESQNHSPRPPIVSRASGFAQDGSFWEFRVCNIRRIAVRFRATGGRAIERLCDPCQGGRPRVAPRVETSEEPTPASTPQKHVALIRSSQKNSGVM